MQTPLPIIQGAWETPASITHRPNNHVGLSNAGREKEKEEVAAAAGASHMYRCRWESAQNLNKKLSTGCR